MKVQIALLFSVVSTLGEATKECCPPSQLEVTAVGRGLMLTTDGGDPYSVSQKIFLNHSLSDVDNGLESHFVALLGLPNE